MHGSRSVNAQPARALIEAGAAALLPGCVGRLDHHAHFREPGAGLDVEQPVPPLGPETALERGERDLLGRGRDAIADLARIGYCVSICSVAVETQ